MISGPAETPSDWMTTSTPVSARFTVAISSASPAILSSLGWSTGILRADRARARTECPASSAALTVSRPIPLLAPMIRTVATPVNALIGPVTHRHVRSRQPHRKMYALPEQAPAHCRLPRPQKYGTVANTFQRLLESLGQQDRKVSRSMSAFGGKADMTRTC